MSCSAISTPTGPASGHCLLADESLVANGDVVMSLTVPGVEVEPQRGDNGVLLADLHAQPYIEHDALFGVVQILAGHLSKNCQLVRETRARTETGREREVAIICRFFDACVRRDRCAREILCQLKRKNPGRGCIRDTAVLTASRAGRSEFDLRIDGQ